MAVTVDLEAAGARKGLFARRADVAVLYAGIIGLMLSEEVVVLPGVGAGDDAWG